MTDDTQVLWLTLDLDPGMADFFGLPPRLSIPDDPDSPFLGGYDSHASLSRLAEALKSALERTEVDPEKVRIRGFLHRWPRYADLDRYLKMGNPTFARTVAASLMKEDAGDPPALYARAVLEAQEGSWEDAIRLLERVLERAPTHALTRLRYALCLAGAGRSEEAKQVLDELMGHPRLQSLARLWRFELDHGGSALRERLREAMKQRGGLEEESSAFASLAEAFPENPEVLYTRAVSSPAESWLQEDPEPARLLRRALAADPGHVPAAVTLAGLLNSKGEREEALAVVEGSLAVQPDAPLLLAVQGQTLVLLDRPAEAERAFRKVFDHPLARIPHASLLMAGQGLLRMGNTDEVRRLLEDAEEARPGDPLPPQLLSRMDENGPGGVEAAERRLRDAVHRCGPVPTLQYALGDLLRRQGRTVEADGIFTVLIRRHPRLPWGYRGKGDLAVKEKPAEALTRYREAFERAPTVPIPGYDYLSGVSELRGGNYAEARKRLERAVAGEPDNARYWCDLGAAFFYLEELDSAIDTTRRALALEPGHPGFLHNLAEYHRVRFRRNPLGAWKSWWKARQLRKEMHRSEAAGWRRDLWKPE